MSFRQLIKKSLNLFEGRVSKWHRDQIIPVPTAAGTIEEIPDCIDNVLVWADTNADEYVRNLRANWHGDEKSGPNPEQGKD